MSLNWFGRNSSSPPEPSNQSSTQSKPRLGKDKPQRSKSFLSSSPRSRACFLVEKIHKTYLGKRQNVPGFGLILLGDLGLDEFPQTRHDDVTRCSFFRGKNIRWSWVPIDDRHIKVGLARIPTTWNMDTIMSQDPICRDPNVKTRRNANRRKFSTQRTWQKLAAINCGLKGAVLTWTTWKWISFYSSGWKTQSELILCHRVRCAVLVWRNTWGGPCISHY